MDREFYQLELEYAQKGQRIAGADEAGRGPLAGPVVAAACIMPADFFIEGIDDSKKLTPKKRDALYEQIMDKAICYGVGVAGVEEIERVNILNAARHAFELAIGQLEEPFALYTDYITRLSLPCSYQAIKKGDAKVYSIAAASIIAKVTRDRMMQEYDKVYPGYGFAAHKGYGTKTHIQAIRDLGPCPIHRMSFLGGILGAR